MSDDIEKRRAARISYRKRTRCKLLSADGIKLDLLENFNIGIQLVNISHGGACISCEGSGRALVAKVGNIIELNIPFQDKMLKVTGRVVWCEKTQDGVNTGLCFDTLTELESKRFQKQLRQELK